MKIKKKKKKKKKKNIDIIYSIKNYSKNCFEVTFNFNIIYGLYIKLFNIFLLFQMINLALF